MPDYQQGKIYRLVSNKTADVYYGSTTRSLTHRRNQHKNKTDCSSHKMFMDDAIVTIVLVEYFPCNTKMELNARELFFIENNPCINMIKPFITQLPYLNEDRTRNKERHKEYLEANKEHIKERHKEYIEANKEHLKEHHKEYRDANKEHIKEYRDANKETESERRSQIIKCECGANISLHGISRHKKTSVHLKFHK
tara:strand:+ start:125 stop:712 length:588 start_codon:yes stop_codon:yes gene_type:complete